MFQIKIGLAQLWFKGQIGAAVIGNWLGMKRFEFKSCLGDRSHLGGLGPVTLSALGRRQGELLNMLARELQGLLQLPGIKTNLKNNNN